MRIFVVGATGFVGGALARHLVAGGHRVVGLARTSGAAAALDMDGITPLLGDLAAGLPRVIAAARQADAVIYAAQPDPAAESATVRELTRALRGTGTKLLVLSGSGVLLKRTVGAWSQDSFAEQDPFEVEPLAAYRKEMEDSVLASATTGEVHAMVIRPGLIWGPGDHGHVPMTYASVAATGSACYVGPGLNVYSHVHVDDVARLVARALEVGRSGTLYHAVAGEVPNRWIAERVAADLGVEARSITPSEAVEVWGEFGALVMAASSRIRAVTTTRELSWLPEHTDMLEEIGEERLRASAGHGGDRATTW